MGRFPVDFVSEGAICLPIHVCCVDGRHIVNLEQISDSTRKFIANFFPRFPTEKDSQFIIKKRPSVRIYLFVFS